LHGTDETAALTKLSRLSSQLWQMTDLQAGLQEMLAASIELLGADMGNIQLLDEERGVLAIHAHRGFERPFLDFFAEVTTDDDSGSGRTLRAGERTIIEDVEIDEPYEPLRPVARDAGYRAVVTTPLIGRSGRPVGMLSVHFRVPHRPDEHRLRLLDLYARQAADFIERLQADAALRENETRYRTLFGSIDEGFCIIEFLDGPHGPLSDYVHVEANPAYARHAGIPNVVGQKVRDMVPHEADGWVELYRKVLLTGEPIRFERELVATGRYLELSAFRIDPASRRQVAVLFQDITARKRGEAALLASEHQLRQMADTMAHMIWVTRPDGYHEWYNQRWYEFTGVPAGSTDGERWNGMFHPDDQARARARWRHSLDTGEYYEIEYRLRHHSGEYRWVLGRAMPIRNEGGEIERWFGTCTDIHAMRQLTDEREQLLESEQAARVEIERASRMKDEFLATLSHEIRTPLNAILGWAIILRTRRFTADEAEPGLETIERNARLQAQMIDDLLDMSRIISGKLRLDVQRIDLAGVIRAAAETVAPAADARDIRVQLVLDPLAGPISGDPNRLQQVFWNLFSNAIKFTPKGGRVQAVLERINSHLEVSVIDSGEGIDPDFLPYVFDRFRQADSTTTRRHSGLGLGLAIVKQVVELHGGTIRAKSPGPGKGATFVVSLPVTVLHPEMEPVPPRRHPTATLVPMTVDVPVEIAGVRVLIVDDEPDARALLRRLFEERGAVVGTASSPAEALSMLRAERPDVLISDIGMPGEDGYALIRQVRALSPEDGGRTPAIALTAYARAEDRVKAVVAGFQHHLSKPIEPMELVVLVASLAQAR
jgi:PAS domain S-box-containing protein